MSVLVVGGAGYIGSHAARALRKARYHVIVYDNLSTGFRQLAEGFELVEGDIGNQSKLHHVLSRVDSIMHFAAHCYVGESVTDPRKYFRNNVTDALTLLNAAVDAGVRNFVFSSTALQRLRAALLEPRLAIHNRVGRMSRRVVIGNHESDAFVFAGRHRSRSYSKPVSCRLKWRADSASLCNHLGYNNYR